VSTNKDKQYSWVPFYEELAGKLVLYRDRQSELIDFLEGLRRLGIPISPLEDKDKNGKQFLMRELDPFTFFATFNRKIKAENRIRIAQEMKKFFSIEAEPPQDFTGLPVVNNMMSWFVAWEFLRRPDDVQILWRVFEMATRPNPLDNPDFSGAFDSALSVQCVNFNLTIGLFWIRPRTFISLDSRMRKMIDFKSPKGGLSFDYYHSVVKKIRAEHPEGVPQLSHSAWLARESTIPGPAGVSEPKVPPADETLQIPMDVNYWMVGAYMDDRDPADQTSRFLSEGIWEKNKFLDLVNSMEVGDRIAIKSTTTQSVGLPFEARGRTISKMPIKATGTIVKNRGDGRAVEVDWDDTFEEREWYFYTNRQTIWQLKKEDKYAQRLIRFAFYGDDQDYDFFLQAWEPYWESLDLKRGGEASDILPARPYSVDDIVAEGVFLQKEDLDRILGRFQSKKNLILQGAPGVGKSFLARKLAYALMQEADDHRVQAVQFHPSFTYEDFVRGYRPTSEAARFELVDGPLLRICREAEMDPENLYVLLIDEVNRGNTSQIFGEFLSLMEADKRGSDHAISPLYRRTEMETFSVPENLYLIGTMNIADRSLALVDYALRRRFGFETMVPRYQDESFQNWLLERRMPLELVRKIVQRMHTLNEEIANDSQLGPDFKIGHSFFCPRGDDFSRLGDRWYSDIVDSEIVPLLKEYWYDSPEKVDLAAERLRAQ